MPSVRSVILSAVLIFGLSLVIACLSMLGPPDSGGMGGDTYGTRAHGYRALFEILGELEVPVRRQLRPPSPELPTDHTLVLLAPRESLVEVEPTYLDDLRDWVERGGRIVLATAPVRASFDHAPDWSFMADWEPPDAFETLGLDGVSTQAVSAGGDGAGSSIPDWASDDIDEFAESILEGWSRTAIPVRPVVVEAEGSLGGLSNLVRSLAVPGDTVSTVDVGDAEPAGTLSYTDAEGESHHLVAGFQRGEGEIIVVGDAYLLSNRFIARAGNSVLAAHLIAPRGGPAVFNEFYHGLSVRGNPMYLLTRPGYAAAAIGILLAVAVWTWREAVFLGPPLPDTEVSRRDIGEYIDAMARFFHRGRGSRRFLLREVRDGVLHHISVEMSLPSETHDVDAVIGAVARRDPARAERLRKAVADVDAGLEGRQHGSESETAQLMQRMTACL